jgi:hypothetical protein
MASTRALVEQRFEESGQNELRHTVEALLIHDANAALLEQPPLTFLAKPWSVPAPPVLGTDEALPPLPGALGLTSETPALKIEKLAGFAGFLFTALPPRSMVGQLPLEQHIGVRIPGGQPVPDFPARYRTSPNTIIIE